MHARLTGAGHTLHISQGARSVAGRAGDWHWWVLDHNGCRVGETVLIGTRLLHERPTESDLKQAYGCAAQCIGHNRWYLFAFEDLKWSN